MKYIITESQLKTLRKYMKTFINEEYMPVRILNITDNSGNILARAKYDSDMDEVYTTSYTKDINLTRNIENRLEELRDSGALIIVLDVASKENDRITYDELMSREDEY